MLSFLFNRWGSAAPADARRVQRVRHEIRRRVATVSHIAPVGPGFLAITFTSPSLQGFVSASFDDHVKFIFEGADGQGFKRDYTPRCFDAQRGELTLEFALHEHGPASDWARQARLGQTAVLAGPRGSMIIPMDYDWHVLVGDASALPAIHRRVEELPAGARVSTLVQVDHLDDRRDFRSAATLEARWARSPDELKSQVRALELPAGQGHVWCAGEAGLMKDLRALWLEEKRQPREALHVAAYWKRGAADFHEQLTA